MHSALSKDNDGLAQPYHAYYATLTDQSIIALLDALNLQSGMHNRSASSTRSKSR
jgi:hypothetical protein